MGVTVRIIANTEEVMYSVSTQDLDKSWTWPELDIAPTGAQIIAGFDGSCSVTKLMPMTRAVYIYLFRVSSS